jgi:O-antigen ligase
LVAVFVALAVLLGGGGSPNPLTELLLEIAFVAVAFAWIWVRPSAEDTLGDGWALVLVAILLVIPLVQLIPLPPAIWSGFPGRQNALAALSLIGEQATWRPISLSPSRTFASLMSIIPAAFCFYAVARLELDERRLVLAVILAMALISSCLGVIQLAPGGGGVNFYPQHHVGWVTGFEANRNAAADILLIGILALAVMAAPYLVADRRTLPLGLTRGTFALLAGGLGLFLLAATAMTGSRAGISLLAVACLGSLVILWASRDGDPRPFSSVAVVPFILLLLIGCLAAFVALSQNTELARVAQRFSEIGDNRREIWQDSWFALKQYWPVGFGMGGFEPAMFPAERLEFLGPLVPNRAHNDYLEIGIEAGILGYAVLAAVAAACLALAWRAWLKVPRMRGQVAFGLTVLILIALHSVVDYPVRSMAVACLSGVAAGLLVKTRVPKHRSKGCQRAEQVRGMA